MNSKTQPQQHKNMFNRLNLESGYLTNLSSFDIFFCLIFVSVKRNFSNEKIFFLLCRTSGWVNQNFKNEFYGYTPEQLYV